MKKTFVILWMQVLAFNQTQAVMLEGHGQCEKYGIQIEDLNNKNFNFFEFSVWDNYLQDENETPACQFVKKSTGSISIKTKIAKSSTFFEVDAKLDSLKENFSNNFQGYEKYCIFETKYHWLSDTPDASGINHTLSFAGNVICFSQNDISFVENLDVLNLLEKSGAETGFTVEMTGAPSPVISGTTIHN